MKRAEPDRPLPAGARLGEGIHHPRFGRFLKEKMDTLGIECVFRNTKDGQHPDASLRAVSPRKRGGFQIRRFSSDLKRTSLSIAIHWRIALLLVKKLS